MSVTRLLPIYLRPVALLVFSVSFLLELHISKAVFAAFFVVSKSAAIVSAGILRHVQPKIPSIGI